MERYNFELRDIADTPDDLSQQGLIIAFVPLIGFVSCKYYNGSKTWVSNETKKEVKPSHWLYKLEEEKEENTCDHEITEEKYLRCNICIDCGHLIEVID